MSDVASWLKFAQHFKSYYAPSHEAIRTRCYLIGQHWGFICIILTFHFDKLICYFSAYLLKKTFVSIVTDGATVLTTNSVPNTTSVTTVPINIFFAPIYLTPLHLLSVRPSSFCRPPNSTFWTEGLFSSS